MDRKKEQKIGQQIMAVRMIQRENSKVSKGGVSFLNKEQLVNAMNVPKEEVDALILLCKRLDMQDIRFRVTGALYKVEAEFGYIYDAITCFGALFMKTLINKDASSFEFSKMENVFWDIYRKREGLDDSDRERFSALFEKSLKYYAKTYIQEILAVYEEGIDCEVIAEIVKLEVFGEAITEDLIQKLQGVALDV